MPIDANEGKYYMRKKPNTDCYMVKVKLAPDKKRSKNGTKRKYFSKCTTREKAQRQINLLNAIRYNKNFVYTRRK